MTIGLTTIPTETDGSLGRDKSDKNAIPNLDHFVPAAEWNTVKSTVADLAETMGTTADPEAGTVEYRLSAVEGGGIQMHTFSNADVTMAAGDTVLSQTGTLSAARTVTLCAASAVSAGHSCLVIDTSQTATAAKRIKFAMTGGDTLVGYADIYSRGGRAVLMSDGTSKWIVTDSSDPRVLWVAQGTSDLGTVMQDASAHASVAWGTPTAGGNGYQHDDGFVFSQSAGTAAKVSLYPLTGSTGFTVPATKRFAIEFTMGPRQTPAYPVVSWGAQDIDHCFYVYRDATSTNLAYLFRNNGTVVTASIAKAIGLDSDYGGEARIEVEYKDAVAATSVPDGVYNVQTKGNGDATYRNVINHSTSLHSSWQGGGSLKPCIGWAELTNASTSSWISGLKILKHPKDY